MQVSPLVLGGRGPHVLTLHDQGHSWYMLEGQLKVSIRKMEVANNLCTMFTRAAREYYGFKTCFCTVSWSWPCSFEYIVICFDYILYYGFKTDCFLEWIVVLNIRHESAMVIKSNKRPHLCQCHFSAL